MPTIKSHKVTVIIPIYNTGTKLGKCIDSILAQTYDNIEILLIDDGSTDDSPEICDGYAKKDNRIIVIHKPNSGVSDTRNTGIEKSTGEYIMFVDSDDYIPADALENLMKPISENAVDYVSGGVMHEANNKRILKYNERKINNITTFSPTEIGKSIYYNQGYVYAKVYSKKIINEHNIRFNTNFSLGEDSLFVKEYLLNVKGIGVINNPVYFYVHEDADSLSGKYVENISDIYSALYDANKRLKDKFGHLTNYAPKCITVTAAEINNIYKKGSPLNTRKERVKFIKSRISNAEFKKSLRAWKPKGKTSLVSKILFCIGNPHIIDVVYSRKSN